jgi:hypothetical protein
MSALSPEAEVRLVGLVRRCRDSNFRLDELNHQKALVYKEARKAGLDVSRLKLAIAQCAELPANSPERDMIIAHHAPLIMRPPRVAFDLAFAKAAVYFVHFPALGRLKIGISNNVPERMRALSRACGAEGVLLASFQGDLQAEKNALHSFAQFRLQGEWFAYSVECAAAVSAYVSGRAR